MTEPARRVIISRRALRDLDAIWSYLAERAGLNTASDIVAEILDSLDNLAQDARNGTPADGRGKRVLSLLDGQILCHRLQVRRAEPSRLSRGSRKP